MKIKQIIYNYSFLVLMFIMQITLCIIKKDNFLSLISAMMITSYIVFLLQNKKFGLYFGLTFNILMTILSLINKLYATSLNNLVLQSPLVLLSIIKWSKSKETNYINIKLKYFIFTIFIQILVFAILYPILCLIKDSQPLLDDFTFSLSFGALLYLINKYKIYWLWNFICGTINSIIWIINYIKFNNGLCIGVTNIILTLICGYAAIKLFTKKS